MKLLSVFAAACLLTGCGASNTHRETAKEIYEQQMAAIAPPLRTQLGNLRIALAEARSTAVAREQLRNLETKLDDGIAKLRAVRPPADIATEHADVIAGYRTLRAEFAPALAPAPSRKTIAALRAKAVRLDRAPGAQAVARALQAMIAKGYDLGFPTAG